MSTITVATARLTTWRTMASEPRGLASGSRRAAPPPARPAPRGRLPVLDAPACHGCAGLRRALLGLSPWLRVAQETQRHEQRTQRHHQRSDEQRTIPEALDDRARDERSNQRDHGGYRVR